MKGHLFLGVGAKVPSLLGWKRIGYDCVSPQGQIFHPTIRDRDRCGRESADINKLLCGEPEAVLVLLGRSCTKCCWGFILHDSEVDIQRGTLTLNTNVMLDIQPKASGFASLNSCAGQRKDGNIHSRHVKELLGFFSFPLLPAILFWELSPLPLKSQYLLLVELPSTWILCQQFSQGKKYPYLRMN